MVTITGKKRKGLQTSSHTCNWPINTHSLTCSYLSLVCVCGGGGGALVSSSKKNPKAALKVYHKPSEGRDIDWTYTVLARFELHQNLMAIKIGEN
jgi:hypothetical protein